MERPWRGRGRLRGRGSCLVAFQLLITVSADIILALANVRGDPLVDRCMAQFDKSFRYEFLAFLPSKCVEYIYARLCFYSMHGSNFGIISPFPCTAHESLFSLGSLSGVSIPRPPCMIPLFSCAQTSIH